MSKSLGPNQAPDALVRVLGSLRELRAALVLLQEEGGELNAEIDAKLIEFARAAHPEVGEALARIVGRTDR